MKKLVSGLVSARPMDRKTIEVTTSAICNVKNARMRQLLPVLISTEKRRASNVLSANVRALTSLIVRRHTRPLIPGFCPLAVDQAFGEGDKGVVHAGFQRSPFSKVYGVTENMDTSKSGDPVEVVFKIGSTAVIYDYYGLNVKFQKIGDKFDK
jgi:hypothetical protein